MDVRPHALGRALALAVLLASSLAAQDDLRIVVLRGTLAARGTTDLAYVTDRENLAGASLAGVTGSDLAAFRGDAFRQELRIYAAAQRAAGSQQPEPLYVLLDPAGNWAYASPWATFRFTRDGKTVGPVTAPILMLGEQKPVNAASPETVPEVVQLNRRLQEAARAFFMGRAPGGTTRRGAPDFQAEVLGIYTLTQGDSDPFDLGAAVSRLAPATYLKYLGQALGVGLDRRGLDGEAAKAEFLALPAVAALETEAAVLGAKQSVTHSVAHELGHMIHFATLGLYGYRGWGEATHMDGNSHSLKTLSTPRFAFVEGFAEAHSMFLVGDPKEDPPGQANRIDYQSTYDYLHTRRPAVPDDDPRYLQWLELRAYLAALQAQKGQLRRRYDFLRSEFAVAATLSHLRERMGTQGTSYLIETMARAKPDTLAGLLEAFAHAHPPARDRLYQDLAAITEGILVTPAQAAAVAGGTLEIDLDRDGAVPGRSANQALPEAFPPEPDPMPGVPDPLGAGGAAAAAPPAAPRRDPDFGGLDAR